MQLTDGQKYGLSIAYRQYLRDVHRQDFIKRVAQAMSYDPMDGRPFGVDMRTVGRILFVAGNDPKMSVAEFVAEVEAIPENMPGGERYFMPKGYVPMNDLPYRMLGETAKADWHKRHPEFDPAQAPALDTSGAIGGGYSTEKTEGQSEGGKRMRELEQEVADLQDELRRLYAVNRF